MVSSTTFLGVLGSRELSLRHGILDVGTGLQLRLVAQAFYQLLAGFSGGEAGYFFELVLHFVNLRFGLLLLGLQLSHYGLVLALALFFLLLEAGALVLGVGLQLFANVASSSFSLCWSCSSCFWVVSVRCLMLCSWASTPCRRSVSSWSRPAFKRWLSASNSRRWRFCSCSYSFLRLRNLSFDC